MTTLALVRKAGDGVRAFSVYKRIFTAAYRLNDSLMPCSRLSHISIVSIIRAIDERIGR